MKKNTDLLKLVIIYLCVCVSILIGSCSNKNDDDTSQSKEGITSVLSPSDLPPGKTVIDMQPVVVVRTTNGEAIKGNNYDGSNSVSSIPEENRTNFLKKKFSQLLVFHADDTMLVNKPTLATLILSKNENIANLKLEVLEESEAKDENIHVDTSIDFGSKMKARLIPFGSSKTESSFNIEALGDDIQTFRNSRKKILWQWKITPLKPGQQELKLSIQVIEKDGESISLPAKNIPVVIYAKPEKFWVKVGNFITNNFEFIFASMLIPILIAWFTTRMRNKSGKNAT